MEKLYDYLKIYDQGFTKEYSEASLVHQYWQENKINIKVPHVFYHPPEAPVMSMALRFLALIMVMVSLPAVGR